MPKILFIDADGTLLDENRRVPESAQRALKEVREADNYCFLCTGRSLKQVQELKYLDLDGMILLNGSIVMIDDQVIYEKPIREDIVKDLFEHFQRIGAGIHVLCLDEVYSDDVWNRQKEEFLRSLDIDEESFKRRAKHDTPFEKYHGEKVYKIDVRFPDVASRSACRDSMDESIHMYTDSGYYSRAGTYYAEINHHDSSKGSAVKAVLKKLNISKENAYGFGDSNNDIPMLEECGTAIVMANGSKDALEIADYVTERAEEDGFINAVRRFDLNRKEEI